MDVITLSDKTQNFTLNCRNWMNNSNWDPWRGPIRFTQNTEIGFMFWKLGLKTNFPHNYWDIKRKIFLLWESRMRNVCSRSFIQSLGDIKYFYKNYFLFKRQEGHLLLALLTLGPQGIASTASIPHCRTVVIKHFYNKINFIFYFISLGTKSWKKQNVSWRTNCERKRTNILRKEDQPTNQPAPISENILRAKI